MPRTLLPAGAAIIVCSGYFLLHWWIDRGEQAPTNARTQPLSETAKLQVVQELSASASTTATAQEKVKVLRALQQVSAGAHQDADLSDREKSDVLQALRSPN